MTPEETKALAREVVKETLIALGVDTSDPLETQKDMAHLRAWRIGTEKLGWKAALTLVTVVVGGLASAAWLGLKSFLGPH